MHFLGLHLQRNLSRSNNFSQRVALTSAHGFASKSGPCWKKIGRDISLQMKFWASNTWFAMAFCHFWTTIKRLFSFFPVRPYISYVPCWTHWYTLRKNFSRLRRPGGCIKPGLGGSSLLIPIPLPMYGQYQPTEVSYQNSNEVFFEEIGAL